MLKYNAFYAKKVKLTVYHFVQNAHNHASPYFSLNSVGNTGDIHGILYSYCSANSISKPDLIYGAPSVFSHLWAMKHTKTYRYKAERNINRLGSFKYADFLLPPTRDSKNALYQEGSVSNFRFMTDVVERLLLSPKIRTTLNWLILLFFSLRY